MNMKEKLWEIIELHSVVRSAWLRIEWLEEAKSEYQQALQEAEEKHDEVVERQEQLMHELAKQAVVEGIAGVNDHLPMLRPVEFGIKMHTLLEEHDKDGSDDEARYRAGAKYM